MATEAGRETLAEAWILVSEVSAWLFFFGLVPMYVNVFVVEKYYTNFWTGFWNIFGLFETTVGLSIDTGNPLLVGGTGLILLIIIGIIGLILFENESELARKAGASWLTSSLSWGLYFGFIDGFVWGVVAFFGHLFGLLVLVIILDSI